MARRYTIQCSVPNTQTRCTLSWTVGGRQVGRGVCKERGRKEGGREGARDGGGRREGGSKGMVGEGGRKGGREQGKGGREEAIMLGRQRASVEEGRVDEGNERGRDGGREEASGGGIGRGREGNLKYPEDGTGQYTVYSQTIPQRGPCH